MKQNDLAGRLEVTPSYLSHVEADRKEPSLGLLRRIAAELDVPPGILLAVALLVDLPPEDREPYGKIVDGLFELVRVSQAELAFE